MPARSRVGRLALSGAQKDPLTLGLLDIALSAAGWGWQSRELSGGGVVSSLFIWGGSGNLSPDVPPPTKVRISGALGSWVAWR